jgi:outer membrane protein insertion porin family
LKRLLHLALLLAAGFAASPVAAQQAPEVRKISFSGAHSFDEALLRAAIVSNATSCKLFVLCVFGTGIDHQYVDEFDLRGDLVRLRLFYYQRGFHDAKVQLDSVRSGERMELRFDITEGTPVVVTSIQLSGLEELSGDRQVSRALRAPLPLSVGAPFNLIDYETARDTLVARLMNLGFGRAEVLANYTIPRDSQYSARVEFEVVPGERLRFGAINVEGSRNIAPKVVQRMLAFNTGDYYSRSALLRSQRNLFGLETFRHVDIQADVAATSDSLVPVVVQVNEADLHRTRFGVGVSTAEFVNTELLWTARNFSGGARRLEVRARVYNLLASTLNDYPAFENTTDPYDNLSGTVSADFSQPWLFDPLNSFNAGAYFERRSLPDIFVRTARGGYVTFSRSLSAGESFSIGYRPELTQLSEGGDLVFCVNFVACGQDEIKVLRDPHWLSPLAVSYARDRSNNVFAPTGGYALRFDGEYAARAVGSDFAYTRLAAELTDYHKIAKGVVLATRLRPGWARALGEPGQGLGLHPQKRFFGGGPNSVRGFAQFRMGPKLLTVNAIQTLAVGTDSVSACTAQQINAGSCSAAEFARHDRDRFDVRPVGGAAILEGNAELRIPFISSKLHAAGFVDFGQVWSESKDVRLRDIVITPGFGLRYYSAIGPVRFDVGYNPHPTERLEVVTTKVCHYDEVDKSCKDIEDDVEYTADQLKNTNELVSLGTVLWRADTKWYQRLQLHFSIGQAF